MISIALKESEKSKERTRHGAIIVSGGRVLSRGHNTNRSHPKWGSGPLGTIHAEADAIRQAIAKGINLKGSTIYVARTGSQMSRPCKNCQKLIRKYEIRKMVYTDGGKIVSEWPP